MQRRCLDPAQSDHLANPRMAPDTSLPFRPNTSCRCNGNRASHRAPRPCQPCASLVGNSTARTAGPQKMARCVCHTARKTCGLRLERLLSQTAMCQAYGSEVPGRSCYARLKLIEVPGRSCYTRVKLIDVPAEVATLGSN